MKRMGHTQCRVDDGWDEGTIVWKDGTQEILD